MLFKSNIMVRMFLIVIALVAIIAMVKLGIWQLDRSTFKAQKQATITARLNEPIRKLPETVVKSSEWRYFNVSVKGQYLPELGILVDNVVNNSIAGVSVVTPFEIEGSETRILVNRGWIPWGVDRRILPTVETPKDTIELYGLLIPPLEGHFYLQDPQDSKEHEQLWSQLDFKQFEQNNSQPLQPLILVLDENQPGSYENIETLSEDEWIARHKAYAVQWFGLAITLMIITIILIYKYLIRKEAI